MSASIIDQIKERVEEARERVKNTDKLLSQARAEFSTAGEDLQAWENALKAESRKQGIPAPSPIPAEASGPKPVQAESNGPNKAEMVRQYLRQHPGSAPAEIFKGLQGKIGKTYLHSLLHRMKGRGVLAEEGSKYSLKTKTASE